MKSVVLSLIFLLISTSAVAASAPVDKTNEEQQKRYQKIFYPDGMPARKDPDSKKKTKTSFQLLNSIKVPDTNIEAVLYSEDLVQTYSFYPEIHLAVLEYYKGEPKIIRNMEITAKLIDPNVSYGDCVLIQGNLAVYNISKDTQILHLSIGDTEPGSGGIWDTSNILYLIDKKNDELHPIFVSKHDSGGGMAGMCCDFYNQTYIYLSSSGSDGFDQILTQNYKFQIDRSKHERANLLDPKINIYKYDATDKKYKLSGLTTTLPPDAIELNRVYDIPVHVDSEKDWENQ